uniref:Uncharacterized protein n=1 Tax=Rhizophagus irregularis (strain DAOM 181602 / DAOM 197198 / MUCL 43194) TaxID=747089 RepID=U9TPH4_RHIID
MSDIIITEYFTYIFFGFSSLKRFFSSAVNHFHCINQLKFKPIQTNDTEFLLNFHGNDYKALLR